MRKRDARDGHERRDARDGHERRDARDGHERQVSRDPANYSQLCATRVPSHLEVHLDDVDRGSWISVPAGRIWRYRGTARYTAR